MNETLEVASTWLREFIGVRRWQRGKADPTHEYTIRSWVPDGEDDFENAARIIREHGQPAEFFGHTYIYLQIDEMKYWTMGEPVEETTVVNRADAS
jgi:hypothetical protein